MAAKLRKYYIQTNKPFVYPNNVILESRDKLVFFKQETFNAYYAKIYSNIYREHYIMHYELITQQFVSVNSLSLKCKLADIEEEQNDYRAALNKIIISRVMHNKYDHYLTIESLIDIILKS